MKHFSSIWWRQYRIVQDSYLGYEAQVRFVLWPFWRMVGGWNTHRSVESAEEQCRNNASQKFVKYI